MVVAVDIAGLFPRLMVGAERRLIWPCAEWGIEHCAGSGFAAGPAGPALVPDRGAAVNGRLQL